MVHLGFKQRHSLASLLKLLYLKPPFFVVSLTDVLAEFGRNKRSYSVIKIFIFKRFREILYHHVKIEKSV